MTEPTSRGIRHFHTKLAAWYRLKGRHDLPWRNTSDAYEIYISEIMLQQTQVETVRGRFYAPFLARFPSLKALAQASPDEVLSAWQGLGYYRRAGHLHQAAKEAGGVMPRDVEGLLALPGIGKNTAHAVAAFAYHLPVAVMEANVRRVLCRIFALRQPTENELWQKAQTLLNPSDPFDYNQAMMDIGSMICTKRSPKCPECPANGICMGKGDPEHYPMPAAKKTVPVRNRHIIVQMDACGRIIAHPRATRFLQGLYHFTEQEEAAPGDAQKIGEIEQSYSHFTLQAQVYVLRGNERQAGAYDRAALHALPMSMAEKKILRLLDQHATSCA